MDVGCPIHGVADDRELHFVRRADVSNDCLAVIQSDADIEVRAAIGGPSAIEFG